MTPWIYKLVAAVCWLSFAATFIGVLIALAQADRWVQGLTGAGIIVMIVTGLLVASEVFG
jgi:hypothetical protein